MTDNGKKPVKYYLENILQDERATLVLAKVLYDKGLWIMPCPIDDWLSSCPEKKDTMIYHICNNVGETQEFFKNKLSTKEQHTLIDISEISISMDNKKDGLQEFVKNCTESDEATTSSDLYDYYRDWCEKNSYDIFAQATFIRQLRHMNSTREVYSNSRSFGWLLSPPE